LVEVECIVLGRKIVIPLEGYWSFPFYSFKGRVSHTSERMEREEREKQKERERCPGAALLSFPC
jgi:hypothetical protein